MDLLLVGLNHKTASVEVREKIYYTLEETEKILPEIVYLFLKEGGFNCFHRSYSYDKLGS